MQYFLQAVIKMNNTIKKESNTSAWIEGLAVQKNKIITICLLVLVMGFMWFKVLTGKNDIPASAKASSSQTKVEEIKEPQITYIQLPFIKGRNDIISRDIFSDIEFTGFNSSGSNPVISENGENDIQNAAKELKLDAILSGDDPEAFINDKLVKKDEIIKVEKNKKIYEFVVVNISRNTVELRCSQTVVALTLEENGM
jgi:hypothetical protein